MKHRFQKIVGAFLCFLIITTVTVWPFAKEEAESTSEALPQTDMFAALGIWNPNLKETQSDYLLRGRFADMLAGLMGIRLTKTNSIDNPYLDVKADSPYAFAVYALKDCGLMEGVNPYQFQPDTAILYADAVKVLLSAMGYQTYVERFGDGAGTVMAVGAKIRLTKGLTAEADKPLSIENAFKLFENALDTAIAEVGFVSEEGYVVHSENRKTLLSQYRDIYKVSGKVSDNGYTALSKASAVGDGQLVVDDIVYQKASEQDYRYLGMETEIYYRDRGTEREIVYIHPTDRNDVLHIAYDDFSEAKLGSHVSYFEEDGDRKKVTLSRYANILWNGIAYPEALNSDFKLHYGSLELIDNDADGSYDVISVHSVKNLVVAAVDEVNRIVYNKYETEMRLEDFGTVICADFTGIGVINAGDILSCEPSRDNKLIILRLTRQSVSGVLNAVSHVATTKDTELMIGDDNYRLSFDFAAAIDNGMTDRDIFVIGSACKVFLDAFGQVADVQAAQGDSYAVLTKVGKPESVLDESHTLLRLFMPNGTFVTAVTAQKIEIDGTKGYSGKDLYEYDGLYQTKADGTKVFLPQLVKCRFNEVGSVNRLETAKSSGLYGYNKNDFSLDYDKTDAFYKKGGASFDGTYTISNNTVIMNIPPADSISDEEAFSIGKISQFTDGSTYHVKLYDADATLSAKICVFESGNKTDDYTDSFLLVDRIAKALDDDGVPGTRVYGCYDGNYVNFMEKESGVLPSDVKQGDLLRISLDYKNRITDTQRIVSLADKPNTFIGGDHLIGGEFVSVFGYLYGKSLSAVSTITLSDGTPTLTAHPINSTPPVYIFDCRNKKVSAGKLSDVIPNKNIASDGSIEYDGCNMVYIYRRMDYIKGLVLVKY